jgi:hypothetical protein
LIGRNIFFGKNQMAFFDENLDLFGLKMKLKKICPLPPKIIFSTPARPDRFLVRLMYEFLDFF